MDMGSDEGRKGGEHDPRAVSKPREASPAATRAPAEGAGRGRWDAHLLPFAKPYNDYFDAVQEAHRSLHRRAGETYTAYVKAAQDAIGTRDAESLRSAAEQFSAAWAELAKPDHMAASVSRAFDTYHREMRSAFASGATSALGPVCFALVAYSMAVVASHRMGYHGSQA
jgi:hypothetical protein